MRNWRCTLACAFLTLILVQSGAALSILDVPILRGTPLIDGLVSPEEMKYAAVTSMTLVGGFDRPKHPTTVVMLVGENAFYAGFICEDTQTTQLVTKVSKENGPVFMDDSVELMLAPAKEADKSNYFHFSVNAAGVRYSYNMSNDRPVANWQAAARRTANGWQAELLIPLSSIGATSEEAHFWRGNAARNRPARGDQMGEKSAWVDPGQTLHNYRRFGYMKLFAMPYPQLVDAYGSQAFRATNRSRRELSTSALELLPPRAADGKTTGGGVQF